MPQRTRFQMIGGFLGAGKTTAIAYLARHYMSLGQTVGIVTNDQAMGLVDTASLRAQGFHVGEVPGACFCCKFDELVATLTSLAANEQPDVLLTEPVGSCTDLVATVIEPLRKLHGDRYDVGPLAVLCKPGHGQRILSGQPAGFSVEAAYIFHKQLEEADIIAVNKVDALNESDREELLSLVGKHFPDKPTLAISATTGEGMEGLLRALAEPAPKHEKLLTIDYDRYAAGEAELGWLNATATFQRAESNTPGAVPFSLDGFLIELMNALCDAILAAGAEPVHLKVLAESNNRVAVANLVDSQAKPLLSTASDSQVENAKITFNARVAVGPEVLETTVRTAAEQFASTKSLVIDWHTMQAFRPGRPEPTHGR